MTSAPGALFEEFITVVAALRDPVTGCPWDLEQTHASLTPYLIEESYEVVDAIERNSDKELIGELGDVLLQVVLHAQLATERGAFSIGDVIEYVREKMVRRHPHVFGSTKVSDSAEVLKNWEQIKALETSTPEGELRPQADSLSGVPKQLPALIRAQRIGDKAAKVNFDWLSLEGVRDKLREELAELDVELDLIPKTDPKVVITGTTADLAARAPGPHSKERIGAELGDVLFSLCQIARWTGVGAEDSLRGTSERFLARFALMEQLMGGLDGRSFEQLEEFWERAKKELSNESGI